MTDISGLSSADFSALFAYGLIWAIYTFVADHSPMKKRTISHIMTRQRRDWMQTAASRELLMVDTGVLKILVTGISFFASATIFVLGGLIAAMGYTVELSKAFSFLPYAMPLSSEQLSLRLALLMAIFIYAFFKFAWAFRLANYTAIVIGGLKAIRDEPDAKQQERANVAADLSRLSGHHFNRGLRAYFFSLAVLGWFVHPIMFVVGTLMVTLILARREFASDAVKLVEKL